MRSRRKPGDNPSVGPDKSVFTKEVALLLLSLCIVLTLSLCLPVSAQTLLTLESDWGVTDGRANAVSIPANGFMIGNLGSYSNFYVDTADWFRVDISQRCTFVASLATAANPGSYLAAYDSSGRQIASQLLDREKGAWQIKLTNIDPGTYYISLSQATSGTPYSYVLATATYQESDRPAVLATFPSEGSAMSNQSPVMVVLSGDIDSRSITQDSLRVASASGTRVTGVVASSGNLIVFYPNQPLTVGTRYTGTLISTIRSTGGYMLGRSTSYSFTPTTTAAMDTFDASEPTYTSSSSSAGTGSAALTVETSGTRRAVLSIQTAGLGPINMMKASVREIRGMSEVVSYRIDGSKAVPLTDSTMVTTVLGTVTVSFFNNKGDIVESAIVPVADGSVTLEFPVLPAPKPAKVQRVVGSIGLVPLGFLNTVRVTITEVTGFEGAKRFRVDAGTPVDIGGTAILVTLDTKLTLYIENASGEVLLSERLPVESNPSLVLVYETKKELPVNHVLVGSAAISIDLFFDQPEAASMRVNEALMAAPGSSIYVNIEGVRITDAFTGQIAQDAQVQSLRDNLRYVVNANNVKTSF